MVNTSRNIKKNKAMKLTKMSTNLYSKQEKKGGRNKKG